MTKMARACEACGERRPSRYRTLLDAYVCPICFARLLAERVLGLASKGTVADGV